MIIPGTTLLRFINWIADLLGLNLDFHEDRIMDPLDESEVSEQLQYGRD